MQAMAAGELDAAYAWTAPSISAISQCLGAKIIAAMNINGPNLRRQVDPANHAEISSTRKCGAENYRLKYIAKKLTEEDLFDTSLYNALF